MIVIDLLEMIKDRDIQKHHHFAKMLLPKKAYTKHE